MTTRARGVDSDAKPNKALSATGRRIRAAVIDLFRARGFHAATMRDIAESAGIESATIYYHFESKEAILYHIMLITRDELRQSAEALIEQAIDPSTRLRLFAENHARFHATRSAEAAITATELHSLSPPWRESIVRGRDEYEAILRGILRDGKASGAFDIEDVALIGRAILTMSTSIALWYRDGGYLSPDDVAEAFGKLALRMAGDHAAGAARL